MAATRGHGLLEGFLARRRCAMADGLIPSAARTGAVLDVGCGSFPLFLHNTRFATKCGVDRVSGADAVEACRAAGITLVQQDAAADALPFDDGAFDVVTMLAVVEHIVPACLDGVGAEVHRVLKHGGTFIVTTPAWWTDGLLRFMARTGLVSAEEIEEHASAFRPTDLADWLHRAGFSRDAIRTGTFELGMNLWATAVKESK